LSGNTHKRQAKQAKMMKKKKRQVYLQQQQHKKAFLTHTRTVWKLKCWPFIVYRRPGQDKTGQEKACIGWSILCCFYWCTKHDMMEWNGESLSQHHTHTNTHNNNSKQWFTTEASYYWSSTTWGGRSRETAMTAAERKDEHQHQHHFFHWHFALFVSCDVLEATVDSNNNYKQTSNKQTIPSFGPTNESITLTEATLIECDLFVLIKVGSFCYSAKANNVTFLCKY